LKRRRRGGVGIRLTDEILFHPGTFHHIAIAVAALASL
jgi:hypothetical protein